mmetsp:Transcript_32101/g.65379  ORF Transcript_32101/g.65379 Transcript_32101/m.65379 type:complete len:287 (-) Transcript_32101:904-1764(-)
MAFWSSRSTRSEALKVRALERAMRPWERSMFLERLNASKSTGASSSRRNKLTSRRVSMMSASPMTLLSCSAFTRRTSLGAIQSILKSVSTSGRLVMEFTSTSTSARAFCRASGLPTPAKVVNASRSSLFATVLGMSSVARSTHATFKSSSSFCCNLVPSIATLVTAAAVKRGAAESAPFTFAADLSCCCSSSSRFCCCFCLNLLAFVALTTFFLRFLFAPRMSPPLARRTHSNPSGGTCDVLLPPKSNDRRTPRTSEAAGIKNPPAGRTSPNSNNSRASKVTGSTL